MPKETVDVLVEGGKATPAPPIGPSLSPLKINVGEVVAQINEKTKTFAGMQVPVKIVVDTETKKFTISVGTPPVTSILRKELKAEKLATVDENKQRKLAGNLPFEAIVRAARAKEDSLTGVTLKAKVKQVLGTCVSCGITVDEKDPKSVIKEVSEGIYDDKIQ
ncbi:MAG: 50S ribosomal protein L11 [Candidatus Aenigmarchaeota archaeon]|nr:50S ribosomal protein L11 [Candidatus Aenigmarchaeota archaeon]